MLTNTTTENQTFTRRDVALSALLLLLALIPRAFDLDRFVTADEAKWVYRSAQFLAALLEGDLAGTTVNLTPAVTTTWLGSLGLTLYYQLHQAAINMPFGDWLRSLPQFRAELDVLVALRWPMVVFTSVGVVAIYLIAVRLFSREVAFLGAMLIALDPHVISLSRILGHDAPMTIFMVIALLLLLLALRSERPAALLIALSGAAAGLAFLSKAPALFLIPFAGLLILWRIWREGWRETWWPLGRYLLLWGVVAFVMFTIAWPAAWVDPIGRPLAVFENAFLSATDTDEADSENYWRVPEWGALYYVVNGGFKLSPLVLVGLAMLLYVLWRRPSTLDPPTRHTSLALLTFLLLFTIFMTLSEKRSPRYILPAFPVMALLASLGWLSLRDIALGEAARQMRLAFATAITVSAAVLLLPYAPYYFSYYNPLLGGGYTAQRLVKVGWGEGLDQVGRFLEREAVGDRVGTAYASTVAPFYTGDLASVTSDHLDAVILYQKQIQAGEPSPAFIRYFEAVGPLFHVDLNGIEYAQVYDGPALELVETRDAPASVGLVPLGFRPLRPYGSVGEPLTLDVMWQAGDTLPEAAVRVTLSDEAGALWAQGDAPLELWATDVIVSQHTLDLPADMPRGAYTVAVAGQPLGEIEVRQFAVPDPIRRANDFTFSDQIDLAGYQFEPTEDYIAVTIAWQAMQTPLPDYTVFVQLLNAETNERLSGVDTQPVRGAWPTSRWVEGEVIVDRYVVPVPPQLDPGFYKVIAGLYRPDTGERLILGNGQDHWTLPWSLQKQ